MRLSMLLLLIITLPACDTATPAEAEADEQLDSAASPAAASTEIRCTDGGETDRGECLDLHLQQLREHLEGRE